jgi:NAD+ kinase
MKKVGIFGLGLTGVKKTAFNTLIESLDKVQLEYEYHPDMFKPAKNSRSKLLSPEEYEYLKTSDYVITLGGDGTILQAIAQIGDSLTPVLGVNLGRLGFLASTEVYQISEAVQAIHEGQFRIQERTMLQLETAEEPFGVAPFALNDFTLHKRDTSSMITINAYIDDDFLATYWADGLIVSTPTGSTGYSLSCGGPIIAPGSDNFIITPVAPHNLNVRPIVISDNSVISFEVEGRFRSYLCSLDSRFAILKNRYRLTLKKCDFPVRLIQQHNYSYMANIRKKLNWAIDKRN